MNKSHTPKHIKLDERNHVENLVDVAGQVKAWIGEQKANAETVTVAA